MLLADRSGRAAVLAVALAIQISVSVSIQSYRRIHILSGWSFKGVSRIDW